MIYLVIMSGGVGGRPSEIGMVTSVGRRGERMSAVGEGACELD